MMGWPIRTPLLKGDWKILKEMLYTVTCRGGLASQILVGFFFKRPQNKNADIKKYKGHQRAPNCLRDPVGFFPPRYMASLPMNMLVMQKIEENRSGKHERLDKYINKKNY
jgi:hypothetical protein